MYSQTEENYLKALYSLADLLGEVSISDLSKSLGVSPPTVNSMVKNLKSQGLVNYEKYKPLSLTKKGQKEAALVIRKHRLTEMFLVKRMGFGWEEVHEIAEQIEHIHSPALFDRMDELLGFPEFDPHGSPIPDKEGKIIQLSHVKLSECKTGEKVRLIALTHSTANFLTFLNSRQLVLGTEIKIKATEHFDGSMTLSYGKHASEVFSRIICESLLVEHLN
ncbi:MAG: metal-dependent transcriptional regulator [Saprospiraceae bacterium]|nr:metal-dependent transcriptional regulator [Saprospiraceae bacterium]